MVDQQLSDKILGNLHIPGDNSDRLSVEIIRKEGLVPKYGVRVEDRSSPFLSRTIYNRGGLVLWLT